MNPEREILLDEAQKTNKKNKFEFKSPNYPRKNKTASLSDQIKFPGKGIKAKRKHSSKRKHAFDKFLN